MWMLRHLNSNLRFYLKPEKNEYFVGRAGELVLSDQTISRTHACLLLKGQKLFLRDENSKYHTFVNDGIEKKVPVKGKLVIELKKGDRVRFGLFANEFAVDRVVISTVTSSMLPNVKSELGTFLKKIGGKVVEEVNETCTHLTMSKIMITVKQLQALVFGIPIVKLEYWQEVMKAVNQRKPLPDVKDFLPELGEDLLRQSYHLFHVNPTRKTLFEGKNVFFFSTRHWRQYKNIIETAGGNARPLDDRQNLVKKHSLITPNAIVIQYDVGHTQPSQSIDSISDYIRSKGFRVIPEIEIQLAILHCSLQQYCNPQYTFDQHFTQVKAVKSDVLVKNTEPHHTEPASNEAIVIQESVPLQENSVDDGPSTSKGRPSKRKLETEHEKPQKVQAVERDEAPVRRSTRSTRRNDITEEAVVPSPPVKKRQVNKKGPNHVVEPEKEIDDAPVVEVPQIPAAPVQQVLSSESISSWSQKENSAPSNLERQKSGRSRRREDEQDEESFFALAKRQKTTAHVSRANSDNPVQQPSQSRLSRNRSANDEPDAFFTIPKDTQRFKQPDTVITVPDSEENEIRCNKPPMRDEIIWVDTPSSTTISTEGWLSTTSTIKSEPHDESISNITPKTEGMSEFARKVADLFIAEVKPMLIISRYDESKDTTDGGSGMNTTTGKNFKKFVKKRNYPPKPKLIGTKFEVAGLTQIEF